MKMVIKGTSRATRIAASSSCPSTHEGESAETEIDDQKNAQSSMNGCVSPSRDTPVASVGVLGGRGSNMVDTPDIKSDDEEDPFAAANQALSQQ